MLTNLQEVNGNQTAVLIGFIKMITFDHIKQPFGEIASCNYEVRV